MMRLLRGTINFLDVSLTIAVAIVSIVVLAAWYTFAIITVAVKLPIISVLTVLFLIFLYQRGHVMLH
ncbi:MAG: hypothetical protein PHN74_02105 [Candidatus Pacebacteria bacterium]|nr:hypothetical protein [Candidatus Paceibacterota bacterium]